MIIVAIKVNSYYACAGIPFELSKCTFWDDANQMQLGDGSTRMICDDDLNLFYTSTTNDQPPNDPAGDMINDFTEAKDFNIPCVMNIYIPGNYNGFTDNPNNLSEGGVANFPNGNINSYGTAFGINGLLSTNADCNSAPGNTSSTAIHEIGHWLGLPHTHGLVNNQQVAPGQTNGHVECPDGSECCTKGDFICDTDPDPNLSTSSSVMDTGGNTVTSCVIDNPPCDRDASACFSTCGVPYPANINGESNIMSYASGSCRFEFTPCQKAKMIDALLCSRSDLSCCDPNFTDTTDPAPYITNNVITICVGDPVPTFIIDIPGNLNANCIGWYETSNTTTDFTPLGTGLTFTPPTTGTAATNTNMVGTYTYYFDDDLNNYSIKPCDDDVRKMVQVVVESCVCDAMAGEPAMATETACAAGTGPGMNGELDASAVDLSTIFAPATGTDVVTNYVVFDQATGEFVGASSTAIADLASLGCSGTVCVKQMAYTQETLDVITSAVDGVLTPFGFAPLTPIDLAGFITFLNDLFGPYTETSLNNLLTNGINVNLFGVIPINIPFPDFCYDFSDAEVCITVINCAPLCDFNTCNAIDVVICGLNWDITGNDQYSAVGTEGTNLNTEIGFTIQATEGLQNSCPGAADAIIDIEICFWEDDSFVVDPFNFNVGEQPNMDYDDCGDPDNEFFIPPFGPTLMFPDDPFGGAECGSACEMFMIDLTAASGAGSFAGTNYNADYIFTCAPEACVCPAEVAVIDESYNICDGGLDTELGNWQTAITGANPLDAVQDPCVFGTIVFSSVPDGDPAFPDGIEPDGVHSGVDLCVNEIQTIYAYLQCDAPDAASIVQTTYAQISRLDLTIWPAIQAATVDDDGLCGPAINTPPCTNYTITNDYDANGAAPDFSAEMAMGNVIFTLTNPDADAPAECSSLDVAATFNCVLPPPIPAFDCPAPTVNLCDGVINLNAVDNEAATAATSTGVWSGTGAAFVVLNSAGIGDDVFDPSGAPVGVQLTLILTLTDGGQSTSTVECTFMVIKDCAANGGQF